MGPPESLCGDTLETDPEMNDGLRDLDWSQGCIQFAIGLPH